MRLCAVTSFRVKYWDELCLYTKIMNVRSRVKCSEKIVEHVWWVFAKAKQTQRMQRNYFLKSNIFIVRCLFKFPLWIYSHKANTFFFFIFISLYNDPINKYIHIAPQEISNARFILNANRHAKSNKPSKQSGNIKLEIIKLNCFTFF